MKSDFFNIIENTSNRIVNIIKLNEKPCTKTVYWSFELYALPIVNIEDFLHVNRRLISKNISSRAS